MDIDSMPAERLDSEIRRWRDAMEKSLQRVEREGYWPTDLVECLEDVSDASARLDAILRSIAEDAVLEPDEADGGDSGRICRDPGHGASWGESAEEENGMDGKGGSGLIELHFIRETDPDGLPLWAYALMRRDDPDFMKVMVRHPGEALRGTGCAFLGPYRIRDQFATDDIRFAAWIPDPFVVRRLEIGEREDAA